MRSTHAVASIVLAAALFLTGCGSAASTSQNLVGWPIDEVQARFGTPDLSATQVVPASWAGAMGPRPTQLESGDAYTALVYRDVGGQQIHLFLVTPTIYQRVKGASPGLKSEYVLEAVVAPSGAVY